MTKASDEDIRHALDLRSPHVNKVVAELQELRKRVPYKREVLVALDEYAHHIESTIECHTVPGTQHAVPSEQGLLDSLKERSSEVQALMRTIENPKAKKCS